MKNPGSSCIKLGPSCESVQLLSLSAAELISKRRRRRKGQHNKQQVDILDRRRDEISASIRHRRLLAVAAEATSTLTSSPPPLLPPPPPHPGPAFDEKSNRQTADPIIISPLLSLTLTSSIPFTLTSQKITSSSSFSSRRNSVIPIRIHRRSCRSLVTCC
ncbi:hypothetical protein QAD02_000993 [Eretmocerus hayati]|uniref:Uncharacterized protein n=1 Tax=Eretmocerus hayati TaxID=131215 RepID=A0ACC2NF69_9HYME|nr:hypothetical protein QAD02_000993 [Eretmocerus hayati]